MINKNVESICEGIRISIVNESDKSTKCIFLSAVDSYTGIRFSEIRIYPTGEYKEQKEAIEAFSNQLKTYLFARLRLQKDD